MKHTQFLGYTAADAAAYVGYDREVIVEKGAYALRVMDGVIPGGYRIQPLAGSINMTAGVTLTVGANASINQDVSTGGTPSFTGFKLNTNTMTFPAAPATIARTDAGQTFTGNETFTGELTSPKFRSGQTGSQVNAVSGTAYNTINPNSIGDGIWVFSAGWGTAQVGYAMVISYGGGGAPVILAQNTNANVTFTVSGNIIQVTQTTGSTQSLLKWGCTLLGGASVNT